ncbi:DNA cytosine methyltransferase [Phenylobacterium sp. LH3H17]|uniref:DNA cytosine methyltransferase n=1 Tax=Phenylobacterium sp. LH3H17 TaxID=2903901 RepID=UPI0020C9E400|nr:DNA cytosine methyltransferase [Phenylobacterium sp. LH3H17]UTP40561.1 DNA cytosine methyltransferase [Phenylobacterium sp. LH3H17]
MLDLFSGCGGLSLGFNAAGFEISAGVEFDPRAAESHGANFHPGQPIYALPRDITSLSPVELADTLDLGPVTSCIDVIVGGPPCQAFARVGRPKLREIESHPEAFIRDPRARLYLEYLAYVEAFQPLALLMENVPDVLNHGGQNIAEETCEVLRDRGYVAGYTLLNSAFYGVPQMRERMILVAYRRELGIEPSFPRPTRFLQLPRGYASSRRVALKLLKGLPGGDVNSYHPPAMPSPELPPAVTAREALSDLPVLTAHLDGGSRRGRRALETAIGYGTPMVPEGSYADFMRHWSGPATAEGVTGHVIRHLPRDWRIFARLAPGDEYPEAHAAACVLFGEELERLAAVNAAPESGSEAHDALRAAFVPPYDVGKFPNKWRKMEPDLPARTLMAHLGKDSYSHIHYDSTQARTISVREAARLQSFPDSFTFSGAMNAAFRQIGNAVPPLLAKAVADEMSRNLAALGTTIPTAAASR